MPLYVWASLSSGKQHLWARSFEQFQIRYMDTRPTTVRTIAASTAIHDLRLLLKTDCALSRAHFASVLILQRQNFESKLSKFLDPHHHEHHAGDAPQSGRYEVLILLWEHFSSVYWPDLDTRKTVRCVRNLGRPVSRSKQLVTLKLN